MLSNFAAVRAASSRARRRNTSGTPSRAPSSIATSVWCSRSRRSGSPKGANASSSRSPSTRPINAMLWNRLRPVFVDIDPRTLNVDCEDLERRIGAADAGRRRHAHLRQPPAIERVMEIARRRGLRVVVDAAHAYGATHARRADRRSAPGRLPGLQLQRDETGDLGGGRASSRSRSEEDLRRPRVPARLRVPERLHLARSWA